MTKTLQGLLGIAAVRLISAGTDLLSGDPSPQSIAEAPESLAWVSGVSALVAAALLVVALLTKSKWLVVFGSLMSFAVYFLFGWSVIKDTVLHVPPDDWRLLIDYWCFSATSALIALSVYYRSGVSSIKEKRREADGLG